MKNENEQNPNLRIKIVQHKQFPGGDDTVLNGTLSPMTATKGRFTAFLLCPCLLVHATNNSSGLQFDTFKNPTVCTISCL